MSRRIDPKSAANFPPVVERHVPLAVIGAGPAGVAAAIEASQAGIKVMLIDENPIAATLMGMDVPYHFGQRINASVQNQARMMERVVESNPRLAEAFDLGVDVQLGTYVWGAFVNGPTVHELPVPTLGLANEERSWLVTCDNLIVAAGARDLGIAFPGWEKPGVMGAMAASLLIERYQALDAKRMVILGSGALALQTAALALAQGVTIAGIVEVTHEVRTPTDLYEDLVAQGIPFLTAHVVKEALGRSGEIESVVLVRVDDQFQRVLNSETEITCDTICLAVGMVPSIELLDSMGCRLQFQSELGGYVPQTDSTMRTSVASVYAVGNCAGVFDRKILDPSLAEREGRLAAISVVQSLQRLTPEAAGTQRAELSMPAPSQPTKVHEYWQTWLRALLAAGAWDVNICQCEEVTLGEVVNVRPPRYLNCRSSQIQTRNLNTLLQDGPVNQDQIKRLTRAGMGPCQGRRCREQIALLLALAAKVPIGELPLASYRPPVRPVPLNVLWPKDEPQQIRNDWEAWFGIPTQWTPHWEIASEQEADGDPRSLLAGK